MNKIISKHYLDHYNDWLLALKAAKNYMDMPKVYRLGDRFIGIISELVDGNKIRPQFAAQYTEEVNRMTNEKYQTFLN